MPQPNKNNISKRAMAAKRFALRRKNETAEQHKLRLIQARKRAAMTRMQEGHPRHCRLIKDHINPPPRRQLSPMVDAKLKEEIAQLVKLRRDLDVDVNTRIGIVERDPANSIEGYDAIIIKFETNDDDEDSVMEPDSD